MSAREPVLGDQEEETARLLAAAGLTPDPAVVQRWYAAIDQQVPNEEAFLAGALKSALERIAERYAVHHVTGEDAGMREALRLALAIVEADR